MKKSVLRNFLLMAILLTCHIYDAKAEEPNFENMIIPINGLNISFTDGIGSVTSSLIKSKTILTIKHPVVEAEVCLLPEVDVRSRLINESLIRLYRITKSQGFESHNARFRFLEIVEERKENGSDYAEHAHHLLIFDVSSLEPKLVFHTRAPEIFINILRHNPLAPIAHVVCVRIEPDYKTARIIVYRWDPEQKQFAPFYTTSTKDLKKFPRTNCNSQLIRKLSK